MKQWYTIPNGLNRNQVVEGRKCILKKLIEFRKYPLDMILDKLLIDKTTGKRIIWATDGYSEYGDNYCDRYEITPGALAGINPVLIQPRAFKALETQQQRTKSKAEVFTPPWIVNKMISHLDEEWFGRPGVFNMENGQAWATNTDQIDFEDHKWQDYVDRSVLEITCGEAPFIVSRYNASTGEIIPIEDRIGVLDRKLRVVTENTDNEEDWIKWAKRAYESVYGYEYQGDNLLIGRINLLMTFLDYYQSAWKKEADQSLLSAITNIITWNFWQMDGLNGTVPLGVPQPLHEQMTLFDFEEEQEEKAPLCKVRKWRSNKTILYKEMETKEGNNMGKRKFDVVIGNPPYQEDSSGMSSGTNPVYHRFIDAAEEVANTVELIVPARFLFNAGKTPKEWNEKMLNDPNLKVAFYEQNPEKVFPKTPLTGGVAILYWSKNKMFEPIKVFMPYPELKSIVDKVQKNKGFKPITNIIFVHSKFDLSKLYKKYPLAENEIGSSGKDKRVRANALVKFDFFTDQKERSDDIEVLGLIGTKRGKKYIERSLLEPADWIDKYKVFVPESNGASGMLGAEAARIISKPELGIPGEGVTQTFIVLGSFNTEQESKNLRKYILTKFARVLLGSLKATQRNNSTTWANIPFQDFTDSSDIDWSKSIPEIDQQLYRKYGLSVDEVEFIETHVKEME